MLQGGRQDVPQWARQEVPQAPLVEMEAKGGRLRAPQVLLLVVCPQGGRQKRERRPDRQGNSLVSYHDFLFLFE